QVKTTNGATVLNVQNPVALKVDYVNAKAMPLPTNYAVGDQTQSLIQALTSRPPAPSASQYSTGAVGSGFTSPVFLGAPAAAAAAVTPEDFGTSNLPFSTARADLYGLATNTSYPYRAAGKLFFLIGNSSYVCSASLIKRGIVVTAAH